jgi:hypothetical protein
MDKIKENTQTLLATSSEPSINVPCKFILEQAMKALRGVRGIVVLFHEPRHKMWLGG